MSADRAAEIAANLNSVRQRISRAAEAAGRGTDDVTLIVITKTWPMSDIEILAGLGVADIGENRDQEAAPKAAAAAEMGLDITWHFVGQLQRNKARHVCRYADFVHAVDRPALVTALDRGAQAAERRVSVFVQVDLDEQPQPGRGGAQGPEITDTCAEVSRAEALDLVGLMAVAPLGADPVAAFHRLAATRQAVMQDFPEAALLSAGMSDDFEQAVAAGATHVRVGSAVLGVRQNVR